MPDIGFKDRHEAAILSGEKPFTLRRAWKLDRTPDLGAKLGFVLGWRTPQRRRFATGIVCARATVWFGEAGVEAFTNWRTGEIVPENLKALGDVLSNLPSKERLRRASADDIIAAGEGWRIASARMANLDGFPDFASMRAFHNAHRAEGSDPVIRRELIGFAHVTPEFST